QGFTPLKTAIAFVLLQGFALVLMPLTARAIRYYNPRWALGGGFLLIGAGDLWLSAVPVNGMSLAPIIAPLVLVGVGFAIALSGVTAVAVNTVPNHLAGMASGTTSQLRDFGFTLGPAVIGAVALSQAAGQIQARIAASAPLRAAVDAVKSGPLGANGVPATVPGPKGTPVPFNPLKDVAFHALGQAYSLGYLICGVAALVSAGLAAAALR